MHRHLHPPLKRWAILFRPAWRDCRARVVVQFRTTLVAQFRTTPVGARHSNRGKSFISRVPRFSPIFARAGQSKNYGRIAILPRTILGIALFIA